MEHIDVVRKLVGRINPVGETHTDDERFENLKTMTILVDLLLSDLDIVASEKHRHEFSRKRAGEFASNFLDKLGIVD